MAFLDVWEEEINEFVKKYYLGFFSKNGFKFLKKEPGQGGGSMVFSDSTLLLEITNVKGRFTIRLGHTDGKLFLGLDLIKAYFKIIDYKIDEDNISARKSALLGTFNADDYSGNATFLTGNYTKIKNLFSSANYNEAKGQMEKLLQEKQRYV